MEAGCVSRNSHHGEAASQLTLAEDSWVPGSGYKAGGWRWGWQPCVHPPAPPPPGFSGQGLAPGIWKVEARVTARLSYDVQGSPQQSDLAPALRSLRQENPGLAQVFCPLEAKGTNAGLCFFFTS